MQIALRGFVPCADPRNIAMMNLSSKWLTELRDVVLLGLLGFGLTWISDNPDNPREFWIIGTFAALMWITLWKGNSYISHATWQQDAWLRTPLRTFVIGIAITVAYTLGMIFILVSGLQWALGIKFKSLTGFVWSPFIITLIVTLFLNGRAFLYRWRQSVMDAEKLKRESISASYENLKSQVNPHFLFNSLNALTNLVYEDQDKAVKFIKQLSEVYRYVLDSRDKEVVSINEEQRCLDAYLFLQKIRFGDKLKVNVALTSTSTFVAPLAIQMLVENAIKHNIISGEQPLTISVLIEDAFIVVRNNLQRKQLLPGESSGMGIENIRRRYSFLSEKNVEVIETDSDFVVKVPLLKAVKES